MVDLIKEPGDPIWRHYVPDLHELQDGPAFVDETEPCPKTTIADLHGAIAIFTQSKVLAISIECDPAVF